MASFHDLRVGETLRLVGAGEVTVTLCYKSGHRARLAIQADGEVAILPQGEAEVARIMPSNAGRRGLILKTA
jgi:hypothetical protein